MLERRSRRLVLAGEADLDEVGRLAVSPGDESRFDPPCNDSFSIPSRTPFADPFLLDGDDEDFTATASSPKIRLLASAYSFSLSASDFSCLARPSLLDVRLEEEAEALGAGEGRLRIFSCGGPLAVEASSAAEGGARAEDEGRIEYVGLTTLLQDQEGECQPFEEPNEDNRRQTHAFCHSRAFFACSVVGRSSLE